MSAACQPTGPLHAPRLVRRAGCVGGHGPLHGHGPLLEGARTCEPGTPLQLVPDGPTDWKWVDADGHTIVDLAPPQLHHDPAAWWAGLFQADPGVYSVHLAATDAGYVTWWHRHHPAPVEAYPGKVPTCCGQPMQAIPTGWRCRQSGRVFAYQHDPAPPNLEDP